ncbi:hypothetical protein BaRGS_00009405 [Batillaria attramentaria]|uniref:Uncharacterized protein n=1 Tax=Batillaria attramentaria TaxID=370345 RepID=A0ABD0LIU2_9CAEN
MPRACRQLAESYVIHSDAFRERLQTRPVHLTWDDSPANEADEKNTAVLPLDASRQQRYTCVCTSLAKIRTKRLRATRRG